MDWLKEPHFYLVGFIYICVRLITNISQVYMSLFINETLRLNKLNLALVPLTIYAMSMLTSLCQKKLNKTVGRTVTLVVGMLICIVYSVIMNFTHRFDGLWRIYLSAVILGLGTSILMIGSLSLTADLIGSQCQTAAFVYGVMSFGDKLSNGISVEIIQVINPKPCNCPENGLIYRYVEVWGIGGISLVGLFLTIILATRKIDKLRFHKRAVVSVNSYSSNNI